MIVGELIHYCSLTYQGNKLAAAGHASYWLRSQTTEVFGADHQDAQVLEAFTAIAAILGYRVEKIEQPVEAPEAKP